MVDLSPLHLDTEPAIVSTKPHVTQPQPSRERSHPAKLGSDHAARTATYIEPPLDPEVDAPILVIATNERNQKASATNSPDPGDVPVDVTRWPHDVRRVTPGLSSMADRHRPAEYLSVQSLQEAHPDDRQRLTGAGCLGSRSRCATGRGPARALRAGCEGPSTRRRAALVASATW